MKKYLLLVGAVLLVFAFASPSMAQIFGAGSGGQMTQTSGGPSFKSWGYLEFHTVYAYKPDLGNGYLNGTQPWNGNGTGLGGQTSTGLASINNSTGASNPAPFGYITPASGQSANPRTNINPGDTVIWRKLAERFRFWLQYGDPKTIRGVIGIEADSTTWGESAWTVQEATTLGSPSNTTSSNPKNRMGVLDDDQVQLEIKHAFVEMIVPRTPIMLTLGLQTFSVGGRLGWIRDLPGVTATVNFAPHQVRAGWGRGRDVDETKYNVLDMYWADYQIIQKSFNFWAYSIYENDLSHADAAAGSATRSVAAFDDHPWWAGLGGEFRPGNWLLSGSAHYLFGKKSFKNSAAPISEQDYGAYAAELLAQYRIGPGLFVRAEATITSGNDADRPRDIHRYAFPLGSEWQWSFGNGRSVFFWMNGDVGFYEAKVLDYTGTWYGRANLEYSPTPWLMFNFNYLYIGDTSRGTPGRGVINSPLGAQQVRDENYVGSELNVIAKIKIYDNVLYGIGFGYFLPGPVYDGYNSAGQKVRSPDNAFGLHSRLMCTF